mmetsp:Transcript_17800/g.15943  ORF Transcript_17800/g.15943 Transcript_17800/m.15943 type:complete len:336 (+) Transcript_17800:46-1053(+)
MAQNEAAEVKEQPENDQDKHATNVKGAFKRAPTAFHDKITAEESKYTAEKDRYHLYYSSACPWCHRVLAMIALKGLEEVISSSDVDPLITDFGTADYKSWRFNEKYPDPLHKDSLSVLDIYRIHDKDYPNQKLTVPILFDKKTEKIVNNESAEIIAFLNNAFNKFAKKPELDLNPDDEKTQSNMTKWNDIVYPGLNDGVYRCGFAKSQEAYDDSFEKIFNTLDQMEQQLTKNRYLCGDKLTLTDVRAWVTLIRFDVIYFTHFKCNKKLINKDYPNIWGYTREILQMDGIAATWKLQYTKTHYYGSHKMVNPRGIIPKGPEINFDEPHGRDKQEYK